MKIQEIVIGENIQSIFDWLSNINAKKVLFVTGKNSFEQSGAANYIQPLRNHFNNIRFFEFEQNPQIKDVYRGIEIFNNKNCDCCIAIGGGSVIDMAKLISYFGKEDNINPELIIKNMFSVVKRKIPLCVVPTTAGSGAESTHFAVLYIKGKKYSLAHKTILPDLVNLNANISFTMSPYMKAISGLDALAQGIESYWSKKATFYSRKDSIESIKLIWNNLKLSVIENDFIAHSKVVLGSNIAGKAINIAKTTASHAFSYYFTSTHNIKHGHAVSLTLGKVYQFNYDKLKDASEKDKRLFQVLNSLLQITDNPKMKIEKFISDLNVELDYSKLNINIKKEFTNIKKEVNIERLKNNPFVINEGDIKKLILND